MSRWIPPLFRELAATAEVFQFPLLTGAPAGMVSGALRPMGPLTVPIILLGQSAYNNYDVLGAMRERENLYLEIRNFTSPDILEYLTAHTGSGCLLFGSRSPMDYLLPTRNIVEYSCLPTESKDRILDKNARQIFLPQKEAAPMPLIDIHAHWGEWPFGCKPQTVEDLCAMLDRYDISAMLFSSSKAIQYDMEEGNRKLFAFLEADPRLYGYVTVNPNILGQHRTEKGAR